MRSLLGFPIEQYAGFTTFDLCYEKETLRRKGPRSQMLKDPRSKAFINHFSRQWLGLDGNARLIPNIFLDDAMKDKMIEETVATFDYVISENRSCLRLIDSEEGY